MVAGQGRNGLDGLKLLRRARAIRPELKVIVTGEPDPVRGRRRDPASRLQLLS